MTRTRSRRWRALLGAALLASLLGFALPGASSARAEPNPTPATPPASARPAAAPDPAAPKITGPSSGKFIGSGTTSVSGTRDADQAIQLLSPIAGNDPLCIVAVNGTTQWSCEKVALPSGPSIRLRVVVTGDSSLADEIVVAVLAAPVVTGGPNGQSSSNGVVRGTGYPGASVTASLPSGRECTATVDGAGAWACLIEGTLSNGSVRVTASQKTGFSYPSSSNDSAPVTIRFDVDRPAAPTVTSPVQGAEIPVAGTSYSGAGEEGATVTVFAGPYSVCSAPVVGGAWSCWAGGVAAGSYPVIAVQQDAAGNVGAGSPPITVAYVLPASASPSPRGSAPPSASADPAVPAVPAVPPETESATPSPAPEPKPEHSQAAPVPGQWNAPTRFTTAVASPWGGPFPWLQAVLLALGVVLLLAIPSRLLAGTISRARGGRPLWGATPIAGRNRVRDEFETAPTVRLNRWLLGCAALVAAAALVMLSGPVIDQPAYLRLLLAVVIALAVVNFAAALVPLWWSSRVLHIDASITFLPRYLALVAVTAIGSRVFDIHPALLFGLLGSVTVIAGPSLAQRGQLAAVRAGSLIALGVAAWAILGALPTADGFLSALVAEIANTVVLGALGSAVLVLIPIGRTSGRSILAWSPPIWAGLTVLAFTIMFAVLSPVIALWQSAGTVTLLWVAAAAFAAVSAGAWAWQRFVAPTQR